MNLHEKRREAHSFVKSSVADTISTSPSRRAFLTLGSSASSSAVRFPSLVLKIRHVLTEGDATFYTLAPPLIACVAIRQRKSPPYPADGDICVY